MTKSFRLMGSVLLVGLALTCVQATVEVQTTSPRVWADGGSELVGGLSLVFSSPDILAPDPAQAASFEVIIRVQLSRGLNLVCVGQRCSPCGFTPIPLAIESAGGTPDWASVAGSEVAIVGWSDRPNGWLDIRWRGDMSGWNISPTNRYRITVGAVAFGTNSPLLPIQPNTQLCVNFAASNEEFRYDSFWRVGLDVRQGPSFAEGTPYPMSFQPANPALAQDGRVPFTLPLDVVWPGPGGCVESGAAQTPPLGRLCDGDEPDLPSCFPGPRTAWLPFGPGHRLLVRDTSPTATSVRSGAILTFRLEPPVWPLGLDVRFDPETAPGDIWVCDPATGEIFPQNPADAVLGPGGDTLTVSLSGFPGRPGLAVVVDLGGLLYDACPLVDLPANTLIDLPATVTLDPRRGGVTRQTEAVVGQLHGCLIPDPWVSSFTALPSAGPAPLTVVFQAVGVDTAKAILFYEWDFDGDGVIDLISGGGIAAHTYHQPDVYLATVTVTDSDARRYTTPPLPVIACDQPAIVTDPADTAVPLGGVAHLEVQAAGVGLTYQWFRGLSGDTSRPVHGAWGNLLPVQVLEEVSHYWVRVTNPCGRSHSAAAQVTGILPGVGDRVWVLPHAAAGYGWETDLQLVNAGLADHPVFLFAVDADGRHRASHVIGSLPPGQSAAIAYGQAFPDLEADCWVVVSSRADLRGAALFSGADGQAQVAIPLMADAMTDFWFDRVLSFPPFFTGISLVNPNPRPATVEVDVWLGDSPVGPPVAIEIPAFGKWARIVADSELPFGQSIEIRSDLPLAGFAIMGLWDDELGFGLSGMPAQDTAGRPLGRLGSLPPPPPPGAPPPPPLLLRWWGLGPDAIQLEWRPPAGPTPLRYRVWSRDGIFTRLRGETTDTRYVVSGLRPGTAYRHAVTLVAADGRESAATPVMTARTLSVGWQTQPWRMQLGPFPALPVSLSGIYLFNPEPEPTEVELVLYGPDGQELGRQEMELPGYGRLSSPVPSLFGVEVVEAGSRVVVGSSAPLIAHQLTVAGMPMDQMRLAALPGQSTGGRVQVLPRPLASAGHPGGWVSVANWEPVAATATVRAYGADGVVRGVWTAALPPNGSWLAELSDLLPGSAAEVAWLRVETTGEAQAVLYLESADQSALSAVAGLID